MLVEFLHIHREPLIYVLIFCAGNDDQISSLPIVAIVVPIAILLSLVGCCFFRRRARKKYNVKQKQNVGSEISSVESLQFDLHTIEAATENFSDQNKLGEGGFGEVYKVVILAYKSHEYFVQKKKSHEFKSCQSLTECIKSTKVILRCLQRSLVTIFSGYTLMGYK
ncbi:hypothetical protein ACE6H2_013064 [Prunus campanulata]